MGLRCAVITLTDKGNQSCCRVVSAKVFQHRRPPICNSVLLLVFVNWLEHWDGFFCAVAYRRRRDENRGMCNPEWASVSAVSWSHGQFITALMSQVTISSHSLHRQTQWSAVFIPLLVGIYVFYGLCERDLSNWWLPWNRLTSLSGEICLFCCDSQMGSDALVQVCHAGGSSLLTLSFGASFWLLRSLGQLPFCQSHCNSMTWKCSFRSEQRHMIIGLGEERLADAAPVLSVVSTQHLKLWRNSLWTKSEGKNLFLNWDFNKQDWGLHVWKVCGNSSSRSICEFPKCLVTSAYNYAEIIFAKMFVFKLAGY